MTAGAAGGRHESRSGARAVFLLQVASVARRSVVRTLRQPASAVPPIVFPLALMAVNAGGLERATALPGFPTDDFYAFALAVPFVQGALFTTMNAGTDLARDIQNGFLNRLSLTPMHGAALLAGHLAGNVALGVAQALIYLAVGVAIGVEIAAGAAGVALLVAYSALVALGFGAVGTMLALRTGSGEAVQGLFPALFVFLFISSMNMPRDLIEIDWFRIAASANPVSYLLETVRSLVIAGWDLQALALGFGIAAAIAAGALVGAAAALRTRLERT